MGLTAEQVRRPLGNPERHDASLKPCYQSVSGATGAILAGGPGYQSGYPPLQELLRAYYVVLLAWLPSRGETVQLQAVPYVAGLTMTTMSRTSSSGPGSEAVTGEARF